MEPPNEVQNQWTLNEASDLYLQIHSKLGPKADVPDGVRSLAHVLWASTQNDLWLFKADLLQHNTQRSAPGLVRGDCWAVWHSFRARTCAPLIMAWNPEPQRRLTVSAGTGMGTPHRRPTWRAMYGASAELWITDRENIDTNELQKTRISLSLLDWFVQKI